MTNDVMTNSQRIPNDGMPNPTRSSRGELGLLEFGHSLVIGNWSLEIVKPLAGLFHRLTPSLSRRCYDSGKGVGRSIYFAFRGSKWRNAVDSHHLPEGTHCLANRPGSLDRWTFRRKRGDSESRSRRPVRSGPDFSTIFQSDFFPLENGADGETRTLVGPRPGSLQNCCCRC